MAYLFSNAPPPPETYTLSLHDGLPISRSEAEQTIAVTSVRDGNAQIYLMDRDGGNPRNITRDASPAYGAVWSPDGRTIAFGTTRDGNGEIYVMDADGGNPRNLTDHAGHDWAPTWAPDGQPIAFTSERGRDRGISVMRAGGGNPRGSPPSPSCLFSMPSTISSDLTAELNPQPNCKSPLLS